MRVINYIYITLKGTKSSIGSNNFNIATVAELLAIQSVDDKASVFFLSWLILTWTLTMQSTNHSSRFWGHHSGNQVQKKTSPKRKKQKKDKKCTQSAGSPSFHCATPFNVDQNATTVNFLAIAMLVGSWDNTKNRLHHKHARHDFTCQVTTAMPKKSKWCTKYFLHDELF